MFELLVESNSAEDCVIALKGEIDIYSAPDFKENLYQAIGEGQKDVVLECGDLSYIDSMGLGILVGALKRIKQNDRRFVVRNPRSTIRKLFKITGLDRVFVIEEAKA